MRNGGPLARIAVIPGDGIGKEVTPVAVEVIRAATSRRNRAIEFVEFDWGADKYLRENVSLPEGGLEMLRDEFDAILFGAVGDPRVPSNQHAADILLGLRFKLDLYVNARPTELFDPRFTPLRIAKPADINLMVFRENTEGLYVGVGGFFKKGTADEVAVQEDVNSRKGVERIIRHAFEYARSHTRTPSGIELRVRAADPDVRRSEESAVLPKSPLGSVGSLPALQGADVLASAESGTSPGSRSRPLRVCMSDKSNAMTYAHDLWQRVFKSVRTEYSDIDSRHFFIDTLAMEVVRDPSQFDVIVTNNLFGDIISDLAAQLAGGLGLAPSANIHPGQTSLFEPVHGSAPNITGKGVANPFGSVLASSMLLDFLGWTPESTLLKQSVKSALLADITTPDLGGSKATHEVADWLVHFVSKSA
jgi:3-isopropylmalate dehydrogenase